MRFCGNCGAQLGTAEMMTGACATCGARITSDGDLIDPQQTVATPPSRTTFPGADDTNSSPTAAAPPPRWVMAQPGALPPTRRPAPVGLLAALGAALLVVLLALVLLMAHAGGIFADGPPNTGSTGSNGAGATATQPVLAGKTPTPTTKPIIPTVTPDRAASPTVTPATSPTPSANPTTTPAPPVLAVTKPSSPNIIACQSPNGATSTFSVANSGGSPLTWTATTPDVTYQINPATGTLAPGAQQSVSVSQIHTSNSVTITANGAENSPQTVTIKCLV